MNFTIKSRKTGETFSFWTSCSGGYIHLEQPGKPGCLGLQICRGGGFMGSTLSCTADEKDFARVCRSWYRQYMSGVRYPDMND